MTEVSFAHLVVVPLIASLALLAALYVFYGLRQRGARAQVSGERIYRCGVCGHVYVDARDVPLARCPRCGCLNEAVKR